MAKLRKAVVLLSGGLDSATALAFANAQGFSTYALTFDYGQRQRIEIDAAKEVAKSLRVQEHRFIQLDLRALGGSALTSDIPVPKDRTLQAMSTDIPITYVPARNTLFLSYALAYCEVLPATDIFIGVNAVDYSGYPDCRPAFIQAFTTLANLATRLGTEKNERFQIHTPLLNLSKAEIIQQGLRLGVNYRLTHSCYDPIQERACGHCDACILRARGFWQANVPDPTLYAEGQSASRS
jgi:7-cyano-7-deazaguanine synthase